MLKTKGLWNQPSGNCVFDAYKLLILHAQFQLLIRIWIDVKPNETSDGAEAQAKFSKVDDLLKSYKYQKEGLERGYRWKVNDAGLEDVEAHARGIHSTLSRFLNENEFLVSLGEKSA